MPASTETAPQPAASSRFTRLRGTILAVGILVILAFAASSAYDGWRAYENAVGATDRELENESKTLAEQTAWTFQAVDLLLEDTARWYRTDGLKLTPGRIDEVLANRASGVRQIRELTVTDAQGIQRYRSEVTSPPNLDVSDRSYFIAHRDHSIAGAFMSDPLITRSENRAAIVLSQRLEDDSGAFLGVIAANVDLEDLRQVYYNVNLGQGSAIQLLRDSGTLLVRIPGTADAAGRSYPQLAMTA